MTDRNDKDNGPVTIREVYELIESKVGSLEPRLRANEIKTNALLVLVGGQIIAAVKGTNLVTAVLHIF